MRIYPIIFVFAATFSGANAAEEKPATVRFSNNDKLSGTLESLDTQNIVWKSPILEKPASFFLKNVLDLKLSPEWPEIDAKHEATVTLTNGDSVRGQIASIADDAVELDTWFAGRMKFRRVMISDIRIDERQPLVYQGPDSLEGWVQSEDPPVWSFKDASLNVAAAGGIAREISQLPAECTLSFDMAWRGNPGLKVVLFSDDVTTSEPAGGYSLTFQTRRITLQNNKTQMAIGRPAVAASLQANEKSHVEIRASSKTGLVSLSIDGKAFPVWKDLDFAGSVFGKGIHFETLNATPMKIFSIRLSSWDGIAEDVPEQAAPAGMRQFGGLDMQDEEKPLVDEKPKQGRMLLRNGDSLEGEVTSIAGDMIVIKTAFKDVRLPVERLKSVALKSASLERCKRENGDVRGWFPDGSSIVFRLEEVTQDGLLVGTNQNFGSAKFKFSAFSRIEFNIYEPDFEDLRMNSGW